MQFTPWDEEEPTGDRVMEGQRTIVLTFRGINEHYNATVPAVAQVRVPWIAAPMPGPCLCPLAFGTPLPAHTPLTLLLANLQAPTGTWCVPTHATL